LGLIGQSALRYEAGIEKFFALAVSWETLIRRRLDLYARLDDSFRQIDAQCRRANLLADCRAFVIRRVQKSLIFFHDDLGRTNRQFFARVEQHGAVAEFDHGASGVGDKKNSCTVVLNRFNPRKALALKTFVTYGQSFIDHQNLRINVNGDMTIEFGQRPGFRQLPYRALLRAQAQQIEVEVKGGLRRIDFFIEGKRETPAFTSGQDLHRGAKAGKTMIAEIVKRIERKQEMIRQMVEKMSC